MTSTRELLRRYSGNPILRPQDLPFLCNAVYNPGAVKFGNRYVLLPRVEDGRRDNRLHVAWSDDGIHFQVEPEPIHIVPGPPIPGGPSQSPLSGDSPHCGVSNLSSNFSVAPTTNPISDPAEYHLYDPRITPLEGSYYITYCSQNFGEIVRIGLLRTDDFKTFQRLPFITPPWGRNCALFPEKIGGLYTRIERPMCGNDVVNLISYSPDLVYWGRWSPIQLTPQTWMRQKWGCGPSPIKTDHGWLQIIHGVWLACNYVYRIGVILLDLENPSKVIGQCPDFILTPREDYERTGETINCVFSNGAILEPDGELKVYYGAADTCIGLATAKVEDLIQSCLKGVHPS